MKNGRKGGKFNLTICKCIGRFPAAGKQTVATLFILLSWFAIYQKYVLIIPRGMLDPG